MTTPVSIQKHTQHVFAFKNNNKNCKNNTNLTLKKRIYIYISPVFFSQELTPIVIVSYQKLMDASTSFPSKFQPKELPNICTIDHGRDNGAILPCILQLQDTHLYFFLESDKSHPNPTKNIAVCTF